jgi:ribonuclease HI
MTEAPPRGLPSVKIYTDGGADPNPGPGGWGVVLVHPASGRSEELSGGEPRTTNNRMELTAAIQALEALRQPCRVELYTDSQYLRRGVTEWLPGWIARGWRRKDGELQNEDLWRRLAAAAAGHEVDWHWVKGHAGHRENERADRLATEAIRQLRAAARTAAAPAAGEAGEIDVFLRVSLSKDGGGWAALIRSSRPGDRHGEAGGAGQDGGQAAAGAGDAASTSGTASETGVGDAASTSGTASETGAGVGEEVLSGGLPPGAAATANALDLAAAAVVLEALPAGAAVAVHTASDYLRHGASRWLPGWRQRGWKTKEGTPVMNRDLWQRLAAAMATRKVRWPEVKGQDLAELEQLGPPARAAARGGAS